MIDRFMRENISLYPDAEIYYGSDEVYDSYPCRFATVGFEICPGDWLRKTMGEECHFYVGLNDYTKTKVDSCISVINLLTDEMYRIDLTEEEQKALYRRLDEEAKKVYGMSCENLLEEARKRDRLK